MRHANAIFFGANKVARNCRPLARSKTRFKQLASECFAAFFFGFSCILKPFFVLFRVKDLLVGWGRIRPFHLVSQAEIQLHATQYHLKST